MMQFDMPKQETSIIKVFGVGGGGSNAVNHMFEQGINGVDFYVCNTDQQALDISPVPNKIQLGMSLTQGRGAGSIAEVGHNAVLENIDEIKEILSTNTKMVFITAGMGGGTGTGAAPVIAKAAKDMGILTVGIVTYPFAFEGRKRSKQAEEGLEKLRESVDTILIISNDKLREIYGNLTLKDAFSKADDILTTAAKGIAEIITVTGYINVDFEDVRTVMTNSGVAIMGSSTAEGEGRSIEAVKNALASPLLNDNNIQGANYILLYITSSSQNEVMMDEITEITDFIQDEAGLTAEIIWGTGTDEDLGDKVNVTLIATGFSVKKEIGGAGSSEKVEERVVHKLEVEAKKELIENATEESAEEVAEEVIANSDQSDSDLPDGWEVKKADVNNQIVEEENIEVSNDSNESYSNFNQSIVESTPKKIIHNLYDDEPESDDVVGKSDSDNNVTNEIPTQNEVKPSWENPGSTFNSSVSSIESPSSTNEDSAFAKELDEEEQLKKAQERIFMIKSFAGRLSNPSEIENLENQPAYIRRNIKLDSHNHSSESNVSRYSLDQNDELRSNNSFLHDNVD